MQKKKNHMRVFSVVNEPVGGSFALSLPFLLSLWSRGVGGGLILNFRLGVEPALWRQPH